ncbi:MAG: murein biosynthesis integral membrane protein MurJ [Bacilli bacterium]
MGRHRIKILTGFVRSIGIITIITVLSKLLGLLREVGIGSSFGVGLTTDAFYAALIIPALLFTSIGVAIQNLFMIEFSAVKEKSEDINEQSKLSSNISNILLVVAAIIFTISFIFTPIIVKVIAPGFTDPEKFNLTVKLTRILLPTMLIIPVYQIRASMLRVYNRFVTVSLIDLAFNIFQILYLLLFADKFGIYGLAYSILFAYIFQLAIIEIVALRMGFRHKAILNFNDQHWRTILRLFLPTFVSFGIIQVNAMVDKIIASNLGEGAISALNYGFMIRNVIYSILISTILLVVYPVLLKKKEQKNEKEYNKIGTKTLQAIFVLAMPLSLLLMVFSQPIIRIVFERSEFTSEATIMTSGVLFYYAIGITFFAIKELLVHVSYTYKNTKMPLLITLIGALLNIIFSIILKTYMGVNGIALGLAISEFITFVIIMFYTAKNKYLDFSDTYKQLFIAFLLNLIIAVAIYFTYSLIPTSSSKLIELIYLSVYSIIMFIIYILGLHLSKSTLLTDMILAIRGDNTDA